MPKVKSAMPSAKPSVAPEFVGGFRNRIQEFKYIPVDHLQGSAKNWHEHPSDQTSLLRRLLTEVGFATALVVRELPEEKYEIIDGHLRTGLVGDNGQAPCLVPDVTEQESEKLLASLDPLVVMAEASEDALHRLLEDANHLFEDETIAEDLKNALSLLESAPLSPPPVPSRWHEGDHADFSVPHADRVEGHGNVTEGHGEVAENLPEVTGTVPPHPITCPNCGHTFPPPILY